MSRSIPALYTWEPEENVKNAPEKIAEYYGRIEGNTSPKEGENVVCWRSIVGFDGTG